MPEHSKISSISLLSWALNEEENLREFCSRAIEFCELIALDYEIIVIDDGSTDGTLEILKEISSLNSRIKYFQHHKNLGVGTSMKRAIYESSMEHLIWQTQDWSYDLDWFCKNTSILGKYDVIHGVRKLSFSLGNRSDNKTKALISLVNYLLIRLLFRAPFSDFQNVTLYKTKTVKSIELISSSSFTSPELLLRTWLGGGNFLEVPVKFNPRKHGVAKGTKIQSILKSVKEILVYRVYEWPKLDKSSIGLVATLKNIPL